MPQLNSSLTGVPLSTSFIGRCSGVMTSLLGSMPRAWQMRGVQVGDLDGAVLRQHAVLVGRADDLAALDAAAGQQAAEDRRRDGRGPASC